MRDLFAHLCKIFLLKWHCCWYRELWYETRTGCPELGSLHCLTKRYILWSGLSHFGHVPTELMRVKCSQQSTNTALRWERGTMRQDPLSPTGQESSWPVICSTRSEPVSGLMTDVHYQTAKTSPWFAKQHLLLSRDFYCSFLCLPQVSWLDKTALVVTALPRYLDYSHIPAVKLLFLNTRTGLSSQSQDCPNRQIAWKSSGS